MDAAVLLAGVDEYARKCTDMAERAAKLEEVRSPGAVCLLSTVVLLASKCEQHVVTQLRDSSSAVAAIWLPF